MERNYDFYAGADLREYTGEWVAIVGEKVIAHSHSAKEVVKTAKMISPGKVPFIAKVPSKKNLLW